MRGRQTTAMLRIMGLEELIAQSSDEYIRIAKQLAKDAEWRNNVCRTIHAKRAELFDRNESITALGTMLLKIAQSPRAA